MFTLNPDMAVYLHRAPIDFRKGSNGLAALVEQGLKLNPFDEACFIFTNRRRDRVKILWWQKNGFWLFYKRLEEERFIWPRAGTTVIPLTLTQLQWLLEGFDLNAMKGHKRLRYQRAS